MSEQQQSEATQSRLLDRVRERDIDLLLLSGFFASQPFLAFMLSRIIEGTKFHRIVRARISETDDAGETDVPLLLQSEDDSRLAVMIENKIGAIFQPSQADRYRQRGEQGVVDGQWDRFRTCLCAPAGYIAAAELGKRWNAYISLEDICKWVGESNDRHLHFVGAILREAIVKHKARLLEISPQATAFWKAYRGLASELLPTAISRLPESVSVASPWPRFGASSLPPNVWLEHNRNRAAWT